MTFCTTTWSPRVGYCRALVRGLQRHHPNCRIVVLWLGPPGSAPGNAPWPPGVQLISLQDLSIGEDSLRQLQRSRLDNDGYLLALEPRVLEWTLANVGSPAIFVADDFQIFGPLNQAADAARAAGLSFVRRSPPVAANSTAALTPLSELPTVEEHLIGVARGQEAWLRAWQKHWLRAAATGAEPADGFLDLAPDLVPEPQFLEPGLNWGWWSPTSAPFCQPTNPGEPALAIHFHGFDHRKPHQSTSEFGDWLPLRLSEHDGIADLFESYSREVASLQVQATPESEWACAGFGETRVAADPFAVRCWRRAYERAVIGREPWPPNGPGADEKALVAWLSEPPEGSSSNLSRYLLTVYEARPDLQLAFPDLVRHGDALLRWAGTHGRRELAIPDRVGRSTVVRFPRPRPRVPKRTAPRDPPGLGVNVVGLLGSHLGLGEAARQTLAALEGAGVPTRGRSYSPPGVPPLRQVPGPDSRGSLPINLLHLNPPELLQFRRRTGPHLLRRRYNIGVWVWETETMPPAWRDAFPLVDEVWTPSRWVQSIFARETDKPVVTIPHPVAPPEHPRYMNRSYLGLPDRYTFLFMLDLNSSVNRKNPVGLIEAFTRAFAPGEGPRLVIKTINGVHNSSAYERLLLAARGRPDILVFDRVMSDFERAALLDSCDCYVSLHRAEGFGLALAEAMALGKPVVATAYSGNLTFMTKANSFLVDSEPSRVAAEGDRYPGHHAWAEPNLEQAGSILRQLWEHPEHGRERGSRAAADILATCSPAVVGQMMRARLESIWDQHRSRGGQLTGRSSRGAGQLVRHLVAAARGWET